MTLKTHLETGIGFGLLISGASINYLEMSNLTYLSKFAVLASILIGTVAGAIYPDIDHESSNLNAEDINLQWEDKLDLRGVVHTLVNVIVVAIPFILVALLIKKIFAVDTNWIAILGISMSAGCVFHMIEDSLTPKGIMWLYPFTIYRFRMPLIKSYTFERIFRIITTSCLLYGAIYFWSVGL